MDDVKFLDRSNCMITSDDIMIKINETIEVLNHLKNEQKPDSNVVNPLLEDGGVIADKSCLNCDNDKPSGLPIDCAIKGNLLTGGKPLKEIHCCYWEKRANVL